jgi:hypothetical protein
MSDDYDLMKCTECGWVGTTEEILWGNNPFKPGYIIHGCPDCKNVEHFKPVGKKGKTDE